MSEFQICVLIMLSPIIIPTIYLDILMLCYVIKIILEGMQQMIDMCKNKLQELKGSDKE